MSSNSDFLSWDDSDLNLDLLLGDYTASDIESDDDYVPAAKTSKTSKETAPASACKSERQSIYQCPECDKTYSSVSGFRGHLRTKHSLCKITVSECRINKTKTSNSTQTKFTISDLEFDQLLSESYSSAIDSIINCTFRNSSASVKGKQMIRLASYIKDSQELSSSILMILSTPLKGVFRSSECTTKSDLSANEQLFSSYYNMTCQDSIVSPLISLLTTVNETDQNIPVTPFIALLQDRIFKQLIQRRTVLCTKKSLEPTNISETDQSVLYYLSGYIISALKKESAQAKHKKSTKHQKLSEQLPFLIYKDSASTTTFISKYSKWTEKLNRGGLKVPCDNFFLLIREFENVYRKCVNLDCISATSLDTVNLTETILDNFMTNYYWDQLCKIPDYKEYILEKCVRLFLTVRGHSTARQIQLKLEKQTSVKAKPLRQVLKDKSNRVN